MTFQLHAYISYNWTEPVWGSFETEEEAKAEVGRVFREGLWYKSIFYFPNWIKRIVIETEDA